MIKLHPLPDLEANLAVEPRADAIANGLTAFGASGLMGMSANGLMFPSASGLAALSGNGLMGV